ncbi:MAG: hypothetical protein ACLP01_06125 [Solirubrobacteraceae bacterium]
MNWADTPPGALILDPVQRYLIMVDIARPLIDAMAVHAIAEAAADRRAPTAHQSAVCDGSLSGPVSGVAIGARDAA